MAKLLGNSFSIRRFSFTGELPDEQVLFTNFEAFSDNLIESYKSDGDTNYQPINNVMGKFEDKSQLIINDLLCFAYGKCKRRATAGAIEYELQKEIEKVSKANEGKKVSKSLLKELRADVKERLNAQATPEFKFSPVFVDMTKGIGYIVTTSETIAKEIIAQLEQILDMEIHPLETYPDNSFATWLWWRMEKNPTKEVLGAEILPNGEVEVVNASDNKIEVVSCKSDDCEECRFALLKGFQTSKLATAFVSDGVARQVTFKGPFLITFKDVLDSGFKDNELECYYDLRDRLENLYKMFNTLVQEFDAEGGVASDVKEAWVRNDFCSRSFEGIEL